RSKRDWSSDVCSSDLSEAYNLDPLWDKMIAPQADKEETMPEGTLFVLFEQEFGRPLSPFEIETINAWLDEDEIIPSLIKAALRRSEERRVGKDCESEM